MRHASKAWFYSVVILLLPGAVAGTARAARWPQNRGVVEGTVVSGSGVGIAGATITLTGPIIEGPTSYTPNPALTAEMRERIERFMAESREMRVSPEMMVNRAQEMEAEFLGLPRPPRPPSLGIPPMVTTQSDSEGRFTFRNVVPGQYAIRGERDGYFGAIRPGASGHPSFVTKSIEVSATGLPGLTLSLLRGAIVSGLARDPEGKPASGVTVAAFRLAYLANSRVALNISGSTRTNPLGEYRMATLPPGDYYIAVTPNRPAVFGGAPRGASAEPNAQDTHARTFYPSVLDARIAPLVPVRDGRDQTGIDILIRAESKFTVSGRAVTPSGENSGLSVFLVSLDQTVLSDSLTLTQSVLGPEARDGRFSIRGVPPGNYELIATVRESSARDGIQESRFLGRARIDVRDRNLDNVEINIEPGVQLGARLLIDGSPAPNGGRGEQPISIVLKSREILPNPFEDQGRMGVTQDAAGSLLFRALPQGRYTFELEPRAKPIPGTYIADIREGGVSILDEGIVLNGRTPGPVEVLVSTKGERIAGTVRNGDKAVPNARVALIPKEERRKNLAYFRTALADASGAFTLDAIAPGDYQLLAWETTPLHAYFNSDFLANYEARGQSVIVRAGGALNIDVQAIMERTNAQ